MFKILLKVTNDIKDLTDFLVSSPGIIFKCWVGFPSIIPGYNLQMLGPGPVISDMKQHPTKDETLRIDNESEEPKSKRC